MVRRRPPNEHRCKYPECPTMIHWKHLLCKAHLKAAPYRMRGDLIDARRKGLLPALQMLPGVIRAIDRNLNPGRRPNGDVE